MKSYLLGLAAGVWLAISLMPACLRADIPYGRTVVYYDESTNSFSRGVSDALSLENLLGHFKTSVDLIPVNAYAAGQMRTYEAVFYVGSSYYASPSAAFLADISTATNTVVWMNYNIWKLLGSSNATTHLGLRYLHTTNGFDSVAYKGDWLYAPSNTDVMVMEPTNNVTVLAVFTSRVNTARAPVPYILKSSNFWYMADNPFQGSTLCDRSLVLADLLHDMMRSKEVQGLRGLARIEDIAPALTSTSKVVRIAAGLTALGVSATYGVIPRYRDPIGQYTNQAPADLPMTQNRPFLRQIRSLIRGGAFIAAHGYTHESGDKVSAEGWEFWDYAARSPLTNDNWAWAEGRVTNSANEFLSAGLPVECWETPHYQASLVDYSVFSSLYRVAHERMCLHRYRTEGLSRAALDAISAVSSNVATRWFPYTVYQNHLGTRTLPENLDRYVSDTNQLDSNGLAYSISNKVEYARKLKVVRDAVAGFYYHPQYDVGPITNLVAEMQALGYTFAAPGTLSREEAVTIHTNPVPNASGATRLFAVGSTNLCADLVLGDLAGSNSLAIRGGAIVSNEESLIGINASSGSNTVLVCDAGSTWISAQTLFVGYGGRHNAVGVLTNGTVDAMDTVIGMTASSAFNGVVIKGAGSVWSNRYGVTVGQAGLSNALYVMNGGRLHSRYGELGAVSSGAANLAYVGDTGSVWTLANYLVVGNGGSGNRLDLQNGGKVESAFGLVGTGQTACSNRVSLTGSGTVWTNTQRLCVGVDGAGNKLEISEGGMASCAALVIGDYSLAVSNEVTVKDADSTLLVAGDLIVGVDGAYNRLLIEEGAHVSCGSVVIGQYASAGGNEIVLSGATSSLTVSNAAGPGSVNILNGKLRAESGTLTAGSFVISTKGQFERPAGSSNVTLNLAGDFTCVGTNQALSLLGVTLAFSAAAPHRVGVNSYDQGVSLQGFVTNRAVGEIEVGGTVTVTNVCYAWAISGSGTIEIADGAVLYYVNDADWSGSVIISGSGRFKKIPIALNTLSPLTDAAWMIDWYSASGLIFRIEWADSLTGSGFQPATNLTGTGNVDVWVDYGAGSRPSPDLAPRRFYRLKAWPPP
jgi:T5SS/PEP-CTERM-associated repeat protein